VIAGADGRGVGLGVGASVTSGLGLRVSVGAGAVEASGEEGDTDADPESREGVDAAGADEQAATRTAPAKRRATWRIIGFQSCGGLGTGERRTGL
jgi:hypothetical protein